MGRLGTYRYCVFIARYPSKQYRVERMPVDILAETDKRYQVRYRLPHANGSPAGHITWVHKRNVQELNKTENKTAKTYAPDIEDVRLPYKD